MFLLVAFSTLLCASWAAPSRPIVVADHHATTVVAAPVAVVSSQSHAQDELGQYTYTYSNPLSSKVESKTVDGITRGGYTYLDSHGLVQNVNYVSDDVHGFRVAASNLPLGRITPQEDEPLVAHEKAKAVAALHEAAIKDAVESTIVHENDVVAPVVTYVKAPEVHAHPAPVAPSPTPYVAQPPAPVPYVPVHSTPAPEVHVTPVPVSYTHGPSATPEVHVTPIPHHVPTTTLVQEVNHDYHPAPTNTVPAEHPHSYAIVEFDASDIPAPHQAPGAYFRPAPSAIHTDAPATVAPAVYEAPAAPSPSPAYTPAPLAHEHPVAVPTTHAAPAPSTPDVHPVPAVHTAPIVVAPVPAVHAAPAPAVVAAPVAVVSTQSHAQDELGQYTYSYSNPLSSKVESKTVDGITRGGYTYLDSHGLVQNVNYVSDDHHGFRVAASNLPSPAVPVDIPDSHDVAAAKAVFFAEIAKAKAAVREHH